MGYASAICMILFLAMFGANRLINRLLGKYMD
jgi:multiple sugar transport system permease protein